MPPLETGAGYEAESGEEVGLHGVFIECTEHGVQIMCITLSFIGLD